jgi:hypothetical protein
MLLAVLVAAAALLVGWWLVGLTTGIVLGIVVVVFGIVLVAMQARSR